MNEPTRRFVQAVEALASAAVSMAHSMGRFADAHEHLAMTHERIAEALESADLGTVTVKQEENAAWAVYDPHVVDED